MCVWFCFFLNNEASWSVSVGAPGPVNWPWPTPSLAWTRCFHRDHAFWFRVPGTTFSGLSASVLRYCSRKANLSVYGHVYILYKTNQTYIYMYLYTKRKHSGVQANVRICFPFCLRRRMNRVASFGFWTLHVSPDTARYFNTACQNLAHTGGAIAVLSAF